MPNLFGVDMKSLFSTALGCQLLPLMLKKRTPGTYNPSDPSAGPVYTETVYSCRGFIEVVGISDSGEIVRAETGDGMILLGTLPSGVIPEIDDTIVFAVPGASGVTAVAHVIGPVVGDPAGVQMRFGTRS